MLIVHLVAADDSTPGNDGDSVIAIDHRVISNVLFVLHGL